ncbi:MAG: transglutaminase domain-containing protein, partial [Lacunisphaera sp.]
MRLSRIPFFALSILSFAATTAVGQTYDPPDWLNAVVKLPTPETAAHAPAVILFDDTSMETDNKGVVTEIHRKAVRILHMSGKEFARGGAFYNENADRVLDANAWLVRDGKQPRPVKKADWVDVASTEASTPINEIRSRQINLADSALAGDVFGLETRVRRPLVVAQLGYVFGSTLPIVTERYSVTVPTGFSIGAQIFGQSQPVATHSGNTWTWTSTNQPYRPNEPFQDPTARDDGDLLINLIVPTGLTASFPQAFSNWPEVASMYESLNQGQCDSSAGLVAKARDLTAGCSTALEKIRALGSFVQKIRYIEINQGLRYGFGWKARKASAVFSNGYGDCKDKANLLIAMLREAGIRAHLVIAMIDPEAGLIAHTEFPSPIQFNHAITAITVDPSVQLPAVIETEKSGRLLFFDPTDPYTKVGDLPYLLQGTNVHVLESSVDRLVQLPRFDAAHDFLIQRHVELTISASETGITAVGQISATGQSGAALRHEFEQ